MVTIAHLVEKLIEDKPFIQEALTKGILNHAALAEQLTPEIERELKKQVKFSAVNMAIRRLSEKLEKKESKLPKFDIESDITIKSDLIEITLYKVEEVQSKLPDIHKLIDFRSGDILTITQGLHEVMIITNKKYKEEILKAFTKKNIKKTIENLSSLTIKLPVNGTETPGIFYQATRTLAWENLSIVDIVSTLTELTLILKEEDTGKAFNILKDLIRKH